MKKRLFLCMLLVNILFINKPLMSQAITPANTQDSLALVDLYNSTNGVSWNHNDNWLTVKPLSDWYGIKLDINGRVISIELTYNNLTGNIPNSIGDLAKLTRLILFVNNLSGNIPSSVGDLHELTEIHLSRNNLIGIIPTSIWNLTNLTRLSLGANQFIGTIPSSIENLTKLSILELWENHFSGTIPSSLWNLINLTILNLAVNQFTDSIPTSIKNLTNLSEVYLYNNQFTGNIPTEIGTLLNLKTIYCSGNQLTGNIPTSISNLYNLTSLHLSGNQLSGIIPLSIGNLSSLINFDLSYNHITGSIPATFGALNKLQFLNLNNNQLSGKIPFEFESLNKLENLYLENNKLTSPIPLNLANLPNLIQVFINNNNFVFDGGLINLAVKNKLVNHYDFNGPTDTLNIFKSNDSLIIQLPITWSGVSDTAMNGLKVEWFKNDVLIESFSRFLSPNTEVTHLGFKVPANILTNDFLYAKITHPSAPGLTLVTKKITGIGMSFEIAQDSLALVDLYNSTNGVSWTHNTNWLSVKPLSDWYGIKLDVNRRVFSIELSNNNLTGNVPNSIGDLTKLISLSLIKNQLTGSIPSSIGNLNELTELYLIQNQLTGNIPSGLWNLVNLTRLGLGDNQLTGNIPAAIKNLTNLTSLDLFQNLFGGNIPSDIGKLTRLTNINLSKCFFTGNIPIEIGNLTNLTALVLNNNQLSGNIPSEIGSLTKLGGLDLGSNNLTGNIPISITNLSKLTDLYLYSNQLSGNLPASLGDLKSIQSIFLSNNQLTGSIPSSIGNLNNLIFLNLRDNQFTGTLPTEIGSLNNLLILDLDNNNFISPILLNIVNLPKIIQIKIINNNFIFDGGFINVIQKNQSVNGYYQKSANESLNLYKSNDSLNMQLPIAWSGVGDTAMNGLKVDWYKNEVLIESFSRFLTPNTEVTYIGYKIPANAQINDVFYAKITHPSAPGLTLYTKKITGLGSACANSSTTTINLCNSELPYHWNGNSYNTAGSYNVVLTNVAGCDSTTNLILNVSQAPNAPLTVITQPTCGLATGAILITLPIGIGNTYSKDGVDYSNVSGTFTGVTPGTYSITVKNTAGCVSPISNAIVIPASGNPIVADITGTVDICKGASATLANVTPSGVWSSDNLLIATVNQSGLVSALETGSATIKYSVSNSCGLTIKQAVVTVTDCNIGGGVPGGGGGGLESKSLGDAVGNRIFNKAVNSLQGPVDYAKLPVINGANRNKISGVGTSLTLSEILPNQIAGTKYKVFNSTPADIASITNAKDVLSIDFTLNDQAKAVAFATKTQGEVYDHTKAICDRLKGSELVNIENVLVNNVKLVRYDLKNTKGQMEYAFSFVIGAKSGRSNYTIQSNWLNKDYTADEVMYNIQLWAETPSLIMNMATDMMNRLTASMPVKEVLSTGSIPKTYVSKGNRDADNIVMNITNTTAGSNGYFEVKVKDNEQSNGYNTKQVPFTITTNGKASVKVPVGDSYEASINMYLNNVMIDQLFMSDGNWATASLSNANAVSSFKVTNDPKRMADNKDDYLVYRNIKMEAAVTDYISVYKILRGAGAAQDLTGYKSLLFNAKTTGVNMKVILVKEGITNWAEQYTLDVPMSDNAKEVVLNLNDFVSTSSKDKINLNDITTIIFSLMNPSGKMVNVTADISNVAFSKTDFAYLNSLKSTELNAYPNPSNGRFTASFKSPRADNLRLTLRDAATGIPVFTKLVNAQVGDNAVPVSVERRTGLNTYILTLEGSGVKYNAKKVFMDK